MSIALWRLNYVQSVALTPQTKQKKRYLIQYVESFFCVVGGGVAVTASHPGPGAAFSAA